MCPSSAQGHCKPDKECGMLTMTKFTSDTAFSCTFHQTITPSRSACVHAHMSTGDPIRYTMASCETAWHLLEQEAASSKESHSE